MIILLSVIFGLLVGSFLNAAIHRLDSGESIVSDRSRCIHCHHILSAWDLIPVVSFIALGGKCRYCGAKISWQYPVVEIFTALCFGLLAWRFESQITNFEFFFDLVFIAFLVIIGVFDLKHYLILDRIVWPAVTLALLKNLIVDLSAHEPIFAWHSSSVVGLLGAVLVAGFFAAQYFLSRGRWIGFGDVKLGLFLGLIFGWQIGLLMLMLAYCLGAATGIALIAWGRKNLGSQLPLGTFLSVSAIIMLIYGSSLASWYGRLLGL